MRRARRDDNVLSFNIHQQHLSDEFAENLQSWQESLGIGQCLGDDDIAIPFSANPDSERRRVRSIRILLVILFFSFRVRRPGKTHAFAVRNIHPAAVRENVDRSGQLPGVNRKTENHRIGFFHFPRQMPPVIPNDALSPFFAFQTTGAITDFVGGKMENFSKIRLQPAGNFGDTTFGASLFPRAKIDRQKFHST